jgi:hypothetical protein
VRLRSIAVEDAVPVNGAPPVQTIPAIVVWVMFQTPDTADELTISIIVPAAPPSAVQLAPPPDPSAFCAIVTVTVSMLFVPDVVNCQVPVHVPARFSGAGGGVGAVGEALQPDDDKRTRRAGTRIARFDMHHLI